MSKCDKCGAETAVSFGELTSKGLEMRCPSCAGFSYDDDPDGGDVQPIDPPLGWNHDLEEMDVLRKYNSMWYRFNEKEC